MAKPMIGNQLPTTCRASAWVALAVPGRRGGWPLAGRRPEGGPRKSHALASFRVRAFTASPVRGAFHGWGQRRNKKPLAGVGGAASHG